VVGRARAAAARCRRALLVVAGTPVTGRSAREKVEQQQIVQLLRTFGWAVYVLGHPSPADGRRHRGTGQTPGLPDLLAFSPAPVRQQVWIEVKRDGQQHRLRPAQVAFRSLARDAGVGHVVGTLNDVVGWLVEHRYITERQVPWYRVEVARGADSVHQA